MAGWLKRLTGGIKARREACAREVLAGLKVRYHTFRVLLANNERALAQLCALEAALGRGSGLDAAGLEDFLETTFELVDGLNRLSGEAHPGLYDLQNRLAATVRELARRIEPESAVPDAPLAATPFCLLLSALPADEEAALALAGGKAANLARLLRAGLPVPPGFVVTTAACRRFLTAAGLDLPVRRTLREVGEGRTSPEEAGEKLARLVTAAPLPDDLAAALDAAWQELSAGGSLALSARSSARVEDRPGMSFAGQFRTILNVTSAAALREAYRQVVAGSFGPRPIGYRLGRRPRPWPTSAWPSSASAWCRRAPRACSTAWTPPAAPAGACSSRPRRAWAPRSWTVRPRWTSTTPGATARPRTKYRNPWP